MLEGKDIGILVNNVGVSYDEIQYFHTLSEEKILNMILVNIAAMTLMTKMVLPKMEEKKKGKIMFVRMAMATHFLFHKKSRKKHESVTFTN